MQIQVDDQIRLELTHEKHTEALFAAIHANRPHLSAFLPWVNSMATTEDARAYIRKSVLLIDQGLESSFMIFSNHRLSGRIGLHHVNPQNRSAAIGYWLSKDAEGMGIVIRSCRALIHYGFDNLNLHRIEIKAAVQNVKSQAVPEKLQFKKEGLLREAEWVNDQFLDLYLYSILKQEWLLQ